MAVALLMPFLMVYWLMDRLCGGNIFFNTHLLLVRRNILGQAANKKERPREAFDRAGKDNSQKAG